VAGLLLTLLVTWFVLTVLLAAWTLWFQGYVYNEPAGEMYWRAPAAGGAVTFLLIVWVFLDYHPPGRYQALHEISPDDVKEYRELWVPTPEGKKELYKEIRVGVRGQPEYHREGRVGPRSRLPEHPPEILVREDDQYVAFLPDPNDKDLYRDERGRVMNAQYPGKVTTHRTGLLLGNLFLNLVLHPAVWFVSFWLLLRFQWPHALGLAAVCWLAMTLIVLPPLLDKTEKVARERSVPLGAMESNAHSAVAFGWCFFPSPLGRKGGGNHRSLDSSHRTPLPCTQERGEEEQGIASKCLETKTACSLTLCRLFGNFAEAF
jgi:hypothetical protein